MTRSVPSALRSTAVHVPDAASWAPRTNSVPDQTLISIAQA
jgi:hypothetical protein